MKVKLTKAEAMLLSIAKIERQQMVEQAESIFASRVQAFLDDHGLKYSDPSSVIQEGEDFFLFTPEAALPLLPTAETSEN